MSYEDYLYETIKNCILSWSDELVPDIYALSLWFSFYDDDLKQPTLNVGYNTNTQVELSLENAGPAEAKWNYAYWVQDDIEIPGNVPEAEEWIKELGLWFTEEEKETDFDRVCELMDEIAAEFIELLISVAQRLHGDGIIMKKFSREIPIIIHELEYPDYIAEINSRANPPDTIAEFLYYMNVNDMD